MESQSNIQQAFKHILMCRPANFGFNEETAADNHFQSNKESDMNEIQSLANKEFDNYVNLLKENEIDVIVYDDTANPIKPDAVFCNNWCSMHEDGTLFLLPMKTPNRRTEVRRDVMNELRLVHKFKIDKIIDYTYQAHDGVYMEGTGSMVIDHVNKIIYACISQRTNGNLLKKVAKDLDYKVISFKSQDDKGREIYHTNVVMGLGAKWCVLCEESVVDEIEREEVLKSLKETGHKIISISMNQVYEFAGNCFEAANRSGKSFAIMSERAKKSLTKEQIGELEKFSQILSVDLKTIEFYGGGSARCMASDIRFLKS